ncbi:Reverse transcriptase domain [Arabidopsis suecica]|uniref:Reverse transcriptase domain n=1 Tax=Arabidopsis suecica TaxID=45249 RepID=A0A8T2BCF0_ARASU|nr:Reverse transcriptase domain [Arabidopsis suecica]
MGQNRKGKNVKTLQEWRPKVRGADTSRNTNELNCPEEASVPPSKRRRSRSGGERTSKKARLGSGEKSHISPSFFERLGSGEKIQQSPVGSVFERLGTSAERSKGSGHQGSNEELHQSPSVFERLGSQVSSSSSILKEKSAYSDHSAHVAAQLSSHSASSAAANRPHSSGTGVGNTPTVRHLREIRGQYFPEITFLCETKNKRSYLENVVGHLGYFDLHTVDPVGKSGGLALMWKDSVQVRVLQSDKRMIDSLIVWQDKEFYLTCIYGEPVQSERGDLWERLTRLGLSRDKPWMLTGDFNELVDPSEKIGGPLRSDSSCMEFRQMLTSCGLWEVKHSGYQYSWYGNRNDELVQCRLDRTVANQAWMESFPQAQATYLQKICSDHSPLINNLVGENWRKWAGFKYDKRWIQREGFKELIGQFWGQQPTGEGNQLMEKIASCRKTISRWKREAKPNSASRLQELQFKINAATRAIPFKRKELTKLKKELNQEYLNEEQFWREKSRNTWMNNGDRNTKFFHATTKNRRAQNRIQKLIDEEGREWTADTDCGKVAEAYFKKLFASEDVGYHIEDLENIQPQIDEQMNNMLLGPITAEEVRRATFKMVQQFFRTGHIEEGMNKTNICLIPKKLKADKMTDFRPISLCNVIYKIIGKLMATRMKKILPKIISESQAAFVKGRLISDNILIAHELIHALSSSNKCSEEFIAIKTDISKAYDRVEWSFLEQAMKSLGFAEDWIKLIMECVRSVKYQVLINGTPYGEIKPTRGLRQGDPLSPYLFVICTEMLVKMLKVAEEKEQITGLKVARGGPPITHLLFADDSMFYCKEKDEELAQITRIIEEYSLASGQRVNYQKSSVHFGKHIPEERRVVVKRRLGIDQEGGDGFYLGLPETFGGSKVSILGYLKESLSKKVSGWQSKFLSPGGKEILLKAVAMALPTYTMNCFKLPQTVCQQLESVMADFWWKNKKEGKGMHWKAWHQLCNTKATGGLGFKDIEAFNVALLGKQLWRMVTHQESLMAKVFKSRYFRKSDPLNAPLGSRPSFAWRSIHEAQNLIKQGARAVIGNGESVEIWRHQWISHKPAKAIQAMNRVPQEDHQKVSSLQYVRELVDIDGREWNQHLLSLLFSEEDRRKILELRPGGRFTKDRYTWDYSKTGHYTVKSGYWVLTQIMNQENTPQEVLQPNLNPIYEKIWKTDAPPKIQHFLWRCLSNCLSVAGNLSHRHLAKDSSCVRCPSCTETVNHLLFQCSFARLIWAISPIPAPPGGEWSDSLYQNLYHVLTLDNPQTPEENISTLIPWLLWRLWKNRNELVFKGKEFTAPQAVNKAKEDAEEWKARKEPQTQADHQSRAGQQNTKWKCPSPGWVKCNTDGAWSAESINSGMGWVLRNHEGKTLWLGLRVVPKVKTVLEIELEALRWAVLTMSRFNHKKIVFESDSKQLITVMKEGVDLPNLDPSIQDIRNLLQHFVEVEFSFTHREGNRVADRIARESLSLLNYVPKLYSIVPSWVKNLVDMDIV